MRGKDVPEELRQCHPVVKKLRNLESFWGSEGVMHVRGDVGVVRLVGSRPGRYKQAAGSHEI